MMLAVRIEGGALMAGEYKMYRHKCDEAKAAAYPRGISITAKVMANLKPLEDGGRAFWVNDFYEDLFPDQTTAEELYCLDCDKAFAQVVRGMPLESVEQMLYDGELAEAEWYLE
jgi:hypothetical protein